MSLELFLILVAACAAYLYYRRRHPRQQSSVPSSTQEHPHLADDPKSPNTDDLFLVEVAAVKRQSDVQIETETREHERELDTRFSDDIELRDRLSQFAKQQA